jgi:hypothetical protein
VRVLAKLRPTVAARYQPFVLSARRG